MAVEDFHPKMNFAGSRKVGVRGEPMRQSAYGPKTRTILQEAAHASSFVWKGQSLDPSRPEARNIRTLLACESPTTPEGKGGCKSMQSASARHIAIMRFLCALGEQFSVADLYRNAIAFSGHRFVRTTFKTRQNGARAPLYYCRCGEIALRDEFTEDFVGLTRDGWNRRIGICALAKLN